MASTCDIPQLVQCVCVLYTHNTSALAAIRDLRWIQHIGRYDRNRSSRAPMQRTMLCLSVHRLITLSLADQVERAGIRRVTDH